jgi:membrane protease YdiL (CAAX protease family)
MSHTRFAFLSGVVLVLYNFLVAWFVGPSSTALMLNLCVAAIFMMLAIRRLPMNLVVGGGDRKSGLRLGLAYGALVLLIIGVAVVWRPGLFKAGDQRIAEYGMGFLIFTVFVRIPLGTALVEEMLFRGVLFAEWRQEASARAASLWSSAFFGLWHVGPTLVLYERNTLATRTHVLLVVAGLVVATFLGGALVLCPLRIKSRGLIAPILLHWIYNGSGVLATFFALRSTS